MGERVERGRGLDPNQPARVRERGDEPGGHVMRDAMCGRGGRALLGGAFRIAREASERFEPAGMTDDPDIRMAQSIMDYVFRRLALDYMDFDTRASMGIYTAGERARQLEKRWTPGSRKSSAAAAGPAQNRLPITSSSSAQARISAANGESVQVERSETRAMVFLLLWRR